MSCKGQGCQDAFLNHLMERLILVSIFLVNGVRLNGVIIGHDKFSLQLLHEGRLQLIYKSAMSTILPSTPISLFEKDDPEES